MPFAAALLASLLIHAAAIVSPGWDLPALHDGEGAGPIEAVLMPPRAEAPAPKPAAPPPKPASRPSPGTPAAKSPAPQPAPVEPPLLSAESAAEPAAVPPAPTPVAAPVPSPAQPVKLALAVRGRAKYAIARGEGGMVVGQSVHVWEQDGFAYRIEAITETTGLAALFKPARILQRSEGAVTAEGLRPRQFRHERVGGTDTAAFDWDSRRVAYEGRESALLPGAQDMLSMYYQLALDVARGGREMQIATGRKVDRYVFEPAGEEDVAVPGGTRRALRVRTRSASPGSDSIELWLDPERIGAPLKIRYVDRRGDLYDQTLDEYEAGDAK